MTKRRPIFRITHEAVLKPLLPVTDEPYERDVARIARVAETYLAHYNVAEGRLDPDDYLEAVRRATRVALAFAKAEWRCLRRHPGKRGRGRPLMNVRPWYMEYLPPVKRGLLTEQDDDHIVYRSVALVLAGSVRTRRGLQAECIASAILEHQTHDRRALSEWLQTYRDSPSSEGRAFVAAARKRVGEDRFARLSKRVSNELKRRQ